ncbi:helix-turn-helix transcriptional regulator, partial [Escherichia coli]
CSEITSLSRSSRWKMEQQGRFPPRCHFGRNSCAWLLSDVLWCDLIVALRLSCCIPARSEITRESIRGSDL